MAKLRVFVKRPGNPDTNVIVINNFTSEFNIDVMQQIDTQPPELKQRVRFTPDVVVIPPTGDLDQNGVQKIALPAGLKYANESYKPKENFRDDGSRLDFADKIRNAVCIGGYLKTASTLSDEECTGKTLGTHSSNDPNSGSYDIGVALAGNEARLRKEVHNNYSESISPVTLNLGSLKNKWVGYQYLKINIANKTVLVQAYVDTDPFDSNGKPKNNWKKVYETEDTGNFDVSKKGDLTAEQLKTVWLEPSIPGKSQNTLRIDKNKNDPDVEYKYVFCREIVAI